MRRENQKYGDGGENVVWQKIAEVSHRAVIEIALRDRKALPSLRKSLIALLKVSITHEPGTDEALAATAAGAEAMPKHRSVAWIIYFLHDLLRFGRVRPVPTADILREAENYVTCAVEMDLLHSQAEAERLLALAYGEGIAYDSWVVRANTPEAEARVIIFGFVTGIARNNARLEQVRSELITGREIAGFRLGLLPSLTDDTWEEVLRLACRSAVGARLDGINALYQWGRYEELSSAAGALRADMRSGKVRFQPGDFGWVRFFEFIGLWRSGCYSRAYELAQTEEPVVYFLSTRNAGFLASVCTELAVRLNRPVNELITFGEQCVNHRDGDG
jgi:hypothetical protein